MRVAMLSWESLHSIAVGGIAAHVSELAAAMARKGHDVHVFTRIAEGQSESEVVDGVRYHRCGSSPADDFIDEVNGLCGELVRRLYAAEDAGGPFDVVHAHDWLTANAMIWVKQTRGRKTLLTFHSTEYGRCGNQFSKGPSERIRDQERAGAYWADEIITVSEACKREIVWMYEAPEWKVTVIHNGVDPSRFNFDLDQGELKRHYRIGPLDPTVLFCGRLAYQKGPDLLVEAIPAVLEQTPQAKFVFLGDGHLRGQLERRAHELGVADAVRILGARDASKVARLFKMADSVCVPSRNEPFGIVVLEAWSAGKPVVATHNGGPGEFVHHEVNGLKVYPEPGSIAWGLKELHADFDRARWMGANGRQAIDTGFNWDRIATDTLRVYDPEYTEPERVPAEAVPPVAKATPVEETAVGSTVEQMAPVGGEDEEAERADEHVEARVVTPPISPDVLTEPGGLLAELSVEASLEDGGLTLEGSIEAVWDAAKRCHRYLQEERLVSGEVSIRIGRAEPETGGTAEVQVPTAAEKAAHDRNRRRGVVPHRLLPTLTGTYSR